MTASIGGRRRTRSPTESVHQLSTLLFAAAVVGGVLLRVAMIGTFGARLNADDAVVYLQSLRASHGHFDTFFWGQAYGGTILQWTVGAAMAVTSRSPRAFQLLSSVWWLAAAVLLRLLVRRMWDRTAGDLAGIALWIGLSSAATFSIADPGFYGPAIVATTGGLLCAQGSGPTSRRAALGVGLFCGLAVWCSPLGVATIVPVLGLFLWRRPWRNLPATVVGGIVGGLPWLVTNLRNGWTSLDTRREPAGLLPRRIIAVIFHELPWAIPGAGHHGLRLLSGVVFIGLVVGGGVLAVRSRRPDRIALAVHGMLAVAVVASSYGPVGRPSVRYAMFLLPAAIAFAAAAITRARPRQLVVGVATVLLAATTSHGALTGVNGAVNTGFWGPPPGGTGGDIRALTSYLEEHGETSVWATYWASYPVIAQSQGRVVAAPLTPQRYLPYSRRAASAPDTVVVGVAGNRADAILRRDTRIGSSAYPPATRTVVAGYVVWRFQGQVALSRLPVALY